MYLHIGKDKLIADNNIIDVSDGNKKSLIIIKEKKQTKGYISNISTITLEKRTNKIGGKR